MENYQIVKSPKWEGFYFIKFKPKDCRYIVFGWMLWLGFWRIEKSIKDEKVEDRLKEHNNYWRNI